MSDPTCPMCDPRQSAVDASHTLDEGCNARCEACHEPHASCECPTDDWLSCVRCDWACIPPCERDSDGHPTFLDGDRATCSNCGTVNAVSVDDADDENVDVYAVGVSCKHGVEWEDGCFECDAEDDAALDAAKAEVPRG